jgi:hypothetical protein
VGTGWGPVLIRLAGKLPLFGRVELTTEHDGWEGRERESGGVGVEVAGQTDVNLRRREERVSGRALDS